MYADYKKLLEFNEEYPLLDWIREMQNHSDRAKYLAENLPNTAEISTPHSRNSHDYRPKSAKPFQPLEKSTSTAFRDLVVLTLAILILTAVFLAVTGL